MGVELGFGRVYLLEGVVGGGLDGAGRYSGHPSSAVLGGFAGEETRAWGVVSETMERDGAECNTSSGEMSYYHGDGGNGAMGQTTLSLIFTSRLGRRRRYSRLGVVAASGRRRRCAFDEHPLHSRASCLAHTSRRCLAMRPLRTI